MIMRMCRSLLYWNREQVKGTMGEEILDEVTAATIRGANTRPSACDAESRATEGRRRQEVDTDFVDLLERAGHQHQQSEADECRTPCSIHMSAL